jgi:hypothetical protein
MQNLLGGLYQMFLKLQSLTLLVWRLVGVLVSFVKHRHSLFQCSGKLRYIVGGFKPKFIPLMKVDMIPMGSS